jgi:hypothetical protein
MEKLTAGFSAIRNGLDDTPLGLLPPHAGKSNNSNHKEMATTSRTDRPKRNLPMHPLVASRLYPMGARRSMEWKTCSLENGDRFSKLALLKAVQQRYQMRSRGRLRDRFCFRWWDAKRWVDDVSMELL